MKNWDLLCYTVINSLKENLAPFLTYHDWKHTEHVIRMSEYIAHKENMSKEDVVLIKTAALFHDAGFINSVADGHEDASILLAQDKLPQFGYTKTEIEIIARMIQATTIPQEPKTKLESILADADLEYLGTDSFERIGTNLYYEIKHTNPNLDITEWNEIQINFLQSHQYHTPYCIQYRNPIKQRNLELLIEQRNRR
jgi:uncharacterized protein